MLTILFWGPLCIYEKLSSFSIWFWGALNTLKGLQSLPFYFGEHCILKRSFQCLLFYLGEHCIFWKVANAYHCILGSTVYVCRVCLHLPFYHLWLRWRKSYYLFIPQIDHEWNQLPPPLPTKFWFIFISLFHVLLHCT